MAGEAKMTKEDKITMIQALETYEASLKRQLGSKNLVLIKEIHERELKKLPALRDLINAL